MNEPREDAQSALRALEDLLSLNLSAPDRRAVERARYLLEQRLSGRVIAMTKASGDV